MRRANYFKIGLFVLSASAILIVAVIALGVGAIFEDRVLVETYFEDSVQGLDIGSAVKFRGVQIGKVQEMTLVRREYETEHRYVLIRMALEEALMRTGDPATRTEIQREVEQGLRVRLGFQGVTGTAYIEVDYLDPERYSPLEIDWTPEHPYIPAAPSIITRVADAIDAILRKLDQLDATGIGSALEQTLTTLNQVLQESDVEEVGTQATLLLKELRETNRHFDRIVAELQVKPLLQEAGATLGEVRELVAKTGDPLRQLLDTSTSAAADLEELLAGLNRSGDLPASLEHLRSILQRLDTLVYTQQREVETTIGNLRRMSENLQQVSEEARDNPAGLLFRGAPPRRAPGE